MLRHDRHLIRPGQIIVEDHGARTIPGVYSQVAGRLLALDDGIRHNWVTGAPNKRSLIAFDHWDSLIDYISFDDLPTDDVKTVHRPARRR